MLCVVSLRLRVLCCCVAAACCGCLACGRLPKVRVLCCVAAAAAWRVRRLPRMRSAAAWRVRRLAPRSAGMHVACPCTWEKMRQREPCCLSRSRSLSSTIIFPAFVTRWSPNGSSDLSSTPSKRYGWLQHLRSCMTRFIKRDLLAVSAADDD